MKNTLFLVFFIPCFLCKDWFVLIQNIKKKPGFVHELFKSVIFVTAVLRLAVQSSAHSLLNRHGMKLLKFYRQNCSPCDSLAIRLGQHDIKHESLRLEENMQLGFEYSVMKVPTLILVDEDGKEKQRWVGVPDTTTIREIQQQLSSGV